MNKLSVISTFSLFAALLPVTVNADADAYGDDGRHFTLGIATYASVVAYDDDPNNAPDEDKFSGFALSAGHAISDRFAFRGTLYSLEHTEFSSIENRGYDILAHVGMNLLSQGFKAYIGGGYFRESWKWPSNEKTFDGLQLSGGVGYNWDIVALDFVLGFRDGSDYEDFINDANGNSYMATPVSAALILSLRL